MKAKRAPISSKTASVEATKNKRPQKTASSAQQLRQAQLAEKKALTKVTALEKKLETVMAQNQQMKDKLSLQQKATQQLRQSLTQKHAQAVKKLKDQSASTKKASTSAKRPATAVSAAKKKTTASRAGLKSQAKAKKMPAKATRPSVKKAA